MAKLNFQQLLLQSLASHDPSEIILICWYSRNILIIIIVESSYIFYNIFVETM